MQKLSEETNIEVCFSDIDALHIVWHGRYVKYFEDARESFGKKYKLGYMDFYREGFMTPLVDIQLSFKKMVKYQELLKIKITYEPTSAAKLIFSYEIYNEENEIVCTGSTVQVITTVKKDLVLTRPKFMKELEYKWLQKNEIQ